MGKTKVLFKKIGDTKGIFHAKMGTIKDINGKGLREEEEIEKSWQEYTEELCKKKGLNDLENHYGLLTHQESDTLECEVKWVLGRITMNKASEGDRITTELFQILKDDAGKFCTQYASRVGKQQWPQE